MKAKRIAALIMAIAMVLSLCMSASAATAVKTVYPCITLEKGGAITVSSLVSPSNTTEKITFSSSDKKIITVSSAGKVTAVAKGTAYVKYTSSNTKKTARLYVKVTETASNSSKSSVIYNKDGIKITTSGYKIVKGSKAEYDQFEMSISVTNNTKQEILVFIDEVYINDNRIAGLSGVPNAKAGKNATGFVNAYRNTLEKYGLNPDDKIKSVSFSVRVTDVNYKDIVKTFDYELK